MPDSTTEQTENTEGLDSNIMSLLFEPAGEAPADADADTGTEPEGEAEEAPDQDATADEASAEPGEDETDESGDAETDEPRFPVKIDGKTEMWTLSELQRAASGAGYIQKGMQEAAARRRQAEELAQTLQRERQELLTFVETVVSNPALLTPPTEPDIKLLETDPIGYMEQKARYDQQSREYQQTLMRLNAEAQRAQALQAQRQRAQVEAEYRLLVQAEPDLAKPEVARRDMVAATKMAVEHYGFTPEEVGQLTDHRQIRVLRDAMRYRQLQGKAGAGVAPGRAAAAPVRPGARNRAAETVSQKKAEEKARARMKSEGTIESVAEYLLTGPSRPNRR